MGGGKEDRLAEEEQLHFSRYIDKIRVNESFVHFETDTNSFYTVPRLVSLYIRRSNAYNKQIDWLSGSKMRLSCIQITFK